MALRSNASPNGPQSTLARSRTTTLMLLATIVAAVTFVMGFTFTKLYINSAPDLGITGLVKTAVFAVFVLSNSIPMLISVVALLILIWSKFESTSLLLKGILFLYGMKLAEIAFVSMLVAFMVGVCLLGTLVPWFTYFT